MKYRKTRINNQDFVISQREGDSDYHIVAYEFVKKLLLGVSKHSLNFYSSKYDFVDFPFTYRERQLDSLILPCISSLCDGIAIAEYPVRRNCKRIGEELDNTHGRIDYWCIYRGFTFVVEVKHSYDYVHGETNESTTSRWNYMNCTQLQTCKKNVRYYEEKTQGVIRIGLQFITARSSNTSTDICANFKKETKNIFNRLVTDMSKSNPRYNTPDFIGCWQIEDKLAYAEESAVYPGLILVAKFHDFIRHKGVKENS